MAVLWLQSKVLLLRLKDGPLTAPLRWHYVALGAIQVLNKTLTRWVSVSAGLPEKIVKRLRYLTA